MTEITQILLFYLIFFISLFLPINIFSNKNIIKKFNSIELSTFNVAINLNILLIFSFFNFSISEIQPYIFSIFFITFVFIYQKKIKEIKKYFFYLIPVFLIYFILSINIASELYLGWDAKFFYYIKSLYFFDGKYLSDLIDFSSNKYHPHLGSYIWGFFWSIGPIKLEYFGRLYYLFIFCLSVFYIANTTKNKNLNYVFYALSITLFYEYEFFSGLQEILLFSFLMILSKYIFIFQKTENNIYIYFILLFSNLLLWIKSEGFVYLFIILFIITLIKKNSFKKKLLIILAFLFLCFFKIFIYQVLDFNLDVQPFYNLDYLLSLNFGAIINKLMNTTIWLSYYGLTNIFFILGLFFIILTNFTEKNHNYIKVLNIYFILTVSFFYAAQIFREMEIIYALRTTLDRLVMTSSGFYVYFIFLKVSKILNQKLT